MNEIAQFVADHFAEAMISTVLGLLIWAFKSWSGSVNLATDAILAKLDRLTSEVYKSRVEIEGRVTKVETEVLHISEDVREIRRSDHAQAFYNDKSN